MSSGLNEDEKRRIETFCETPPYERSPEDLRPSSDYPDEAGPSDETEESVLASVWNCISTHVPIPKRRWDR